MAAATTIPKDSFTVTNRKSFSYYQEYRGNIDVRSLLVDDARVIMCSKLIRLCK